MAWSKELQESWKAQHDIKSQQKECVVCGSPITKDEYNEYNQKNFNMFRQIRKRFRQWLNKSDQPRYLSGKGRLK